jgi:hypothetical protein
MSLPPPLPTPLGTCFDSAISSGSSGRAVILDGFDLERCCVLVTRGEVWGRGFEREAGGVRSVRNEVGKREDLIVAVGGGPEGGDTDFPLSFEELSDTEEGGGVNHLTSLAQS